MTTNPTPPHREDQAIRQEDTMRHQSSCECTSPISGSKYSVTVIGDAEQRRNGKNYAADVYICIYVGGLSCSTSMKPDEARQLAEQLAAAAVAAETPEPEIIPYRLAEAA
jgi:mitochondrial fission protein ELM1